MNEAHTLPRIGAYLIDMFIIALLVSLLTLPIPTSEKYNNAVKEGNDLIKNILKDDFDFEKYYEESSRIRYTLDKESIVTTLVQSVLTVGYFVTFAYYNDGKTLGKKLLKIKISSSDGRELTHLKLLGREVLFTGVLSSLINTIFILFINYNQYNSTIGTVTMFQSIFLIVSIFMIIFRKDKCGLHDLLFKTRVIEE